MDLADPHPFWEPRENPSFDCFLRAWHDDRMFGFIAPPAWREMRMRGDVPVFVTGPDFELPSVAASGGEHHIHIRPIEPNRRDLGLEIGDHDARVRIDWSRAVPEELAAIFQADSSIRKLWNALSFADACDLLKPIRRKRTAESRLKLVPQLVKDIAALAGGR